MARSVEDIQLEIINEKNNHVELNDLNSNSQSSVWRLWTFITATIINIHETIFDLFKSEVDTKLSNARVTTPQWFVEQAKLFQLDDDLIILSNGNAGYAVVDETKQIITRASITENTGSTVNLKVAKGSTGNTAVALSSTELAQFNKYIEKIKPAGVSVTTISLNADELILSGATVFFDKIFDPTDIQTSVEAGLLNYMNNLPFNGEVVTNEIIDAIQGVTGVNDVTINSVILRQGMNDTVINRKAITSAGYINESDDIGFTFSDTITYTAE